MTPAPEYKFKFYKWIESDKTIIYRSGDMLDERLPKPGMLGLWTHFSLIDWPVERILSSWSSVIMEYTAARLGAQHPNVNYMRFDIEFHDPTLGYGKLASKSEMIVGTPSVVNMCYYNDLIAAMDGKKDEQHRLDIKWDMVPESYWFFFYLECEK